MNRLLLAAAATILFASAPASAGDHAVAGFKWSGICLTCFSKIHQHGPLFNYGPYFGYPPFEPYGPWNQYLQYGGYSSYGNVGTSTQSYQAPAGDCASCRGNAPVVQPQLAPTVPAYTQGSYNPYLPASYVPPSASGNGAPVVPLYPQR